VLVGVKGSDCSGVVVMLMLLLLLLIVDAMMMVRIKVGVPVFAAVCDCWGGVTVVSASCPHHVPQGPFQALNCDCCPLFIAVAALLFVLPIVLAFLSFDATASKKWLWLAISDVTLVLCLIAFAKHCITPFCPLPRQKLS
jgi:cobalamin synthase